MFAFERRERAWTEARERALRLLARKRSDPKITYVDIVL
jgi:hypothetical protein